jgi:hypothetical protein
MCSFLELDIDSVARIGLLYLDGDKLEKVLLDKYGPTDYDFDLFNDLKKSVMKMEKINPVLNLSAVLWILHPNNEELGYPMVAGNALPFEGWMINKANKALKDMFTSGNKQVLKRSEVCSSHYFPIKNSDAEIVGALEFIYGNREKVDI